MATNTRWTKPLGMPVTAHFYPDPDAEARYGVVYLANGQRLESLTLIELQAVARAEQVFHGGAIESLPEKRPMIHKPGRPRKQVAAN